jgi:hypothetical protein
MKACSRKLGRDMVVLGAHKQPEVEGINESIAAVQLHSPDQHGPQQNRASSATCPG